MTPQKFASIDIDSDNGVRGPRYRTRRGFTGVEVDRVAPRINGRRRPDRNARRCVQLRAGGVLSSGLWFANGVVLPDLLARIGIERHHAAPRRAARIDGL